MNDKSPPHPGATPDDSMLTRESWKIFQIMTEFVEGFERPAETLTLIQTSKRSSWYADLSGAA